MSTRRKVYTFYIIAILVMVLVLMLFDLNIMAKAIVGVMIVFCIFVDAKHSDGLPTSR